MVMKLHISKHFKGLRAFFSLLLVVNFLGYSTPLSAQEEPAEAAVAEDAGGAIDGKSLFESSCAACHKADARDKKLVGPGLKDARKTWKEKVKIPDLIYTWVVNPNKAAATGDPYVKELLNYDGSAMTPQPFSKEEIDAIFDYVDAYTPPASTGDPAGAVAAAEEEDNSTWWIVIGIMFMIVAVSAGSFRRQLRNAMREKNGKEKLADRSYLDVLKEWAWRNKKLAAMIFILVFIMGMGEVWDRLYGIGVYTGYHPEQPIDFPHSVHAGLNEIDCQYCHSSASKSKHAGIPSVNVCMNCHKGIEGSSEPAKAQIAKIYEAAGFDSETKAYTKEPKPIQWVKVHNLPDHVYFPHAQHVSVAGVECQTCHGEVEKMGTVKQFAPLTMGWCVTCHNETEVALTNNGAYYDEIHRRLLKDKSLYQQYLEDDIVTVRELGGWECVKCHY
jgi:mono/diheme cytochrome c family protein